MWIITAWQHILPEIIVKGFKKYWISNAVDDDDDDDGDDNMLWNGREEDGNVRTACEEDEGTDCEEGYTDTDW